MVGIGPHFENQRAGRIEDAGDDDFALGRIGEDVTF
jgi:hypothetical protein